MCSLEKFGNIASSFQEATGICYFSTCLGTLEQTFSCGDWKHPICQLLGRIHRVVADFWETTVSGHKPRGYFLFLPKLSPLSFRGNLSLDDFMSPRHLCLKGLFIVVRQRTWTQTAEVLLMLRWEAEGCIWGVAYWPLPGGGERVGRLFSGLVPCHMDVFMDMFSRNVATRELYSMSVWPSLVCVIS